MQNNNRNLLMERYPEIGFLFNYVPFEPFTLFTDNDGKLNAKRENWLLHVETEKEIENWKRKLDLDELDILYIFGIGLGYHYDFLRGWLDKKRGRRLIFLEEDLGVIAAFLERKGADQLLLDSRVHIRFVVDRKEWNLKIEELAQEFISDKVGCTIICSYRPFHGRRFKNIELKLMRATAAIHALLSESLHAEKIFANLYPNFKKLPTAFFANKFEGQFKNIPAIICGAGPSLKDVIPHLKELENKALIIAGGSTMAALSRHGIEPHLGMAVDPNSEEYDRLKPSTAFETPLLYANRVLPDIFATCNGPHGYMRSDTGGLPEVWLEEKLGIEDKAIGPDLGREAFSVTTLAVALAYSMGCNPIILAGVDLAYTGMQRYADGVLETANQVSLSNIKADKRLTERLLKRKDRQGNLVYTLLKWVMESSCISSYAKKHPERQFINATDGGIGFRDVPYEPFEKVSKTFVRTYNLRGKIHALSQQTRFNLDLSLLNTLFKDLAHSLEKQQHLAAEILKETTGRLAMLEMDFVEEVGFDCFLQPLAPALDSLLQRYLPSEEHHRTKWAHIQEVISRYLQTLRQVEYLKE